MKKLMFLLFLAPLFVACEDSDNGTTAPDEFLPTKIASGDFLYEWYEYDSQGRMTSCEDSLTSIKLSYDGTALKKSIVTTEEIDRVVEFSKSGNSIICNQSIYEINTNNLIRTAKQTITLGSNGLPVKIDDGDESTYYCTFEYDNDLNVTKIEAYFMGELFEKYTFKYDSQIGAMSKVRTPAWWFVYNTWTFNRSEPYFMYSNNLTEYTVVDQRDRQSTIKYNYAYDDAGYPTGFKKETNSDNHYNYRTINYTKF